MNLEHLQFSSFKRSAITVKLSHADSDFISTAYFQ